MELVWDGNREGFIGDMDAEAAILERDTTGRVYGFPKDHKDSTRHRNTTTGWSSHVVVQQGLTLVG